MDAVLDFLKRNSGAVGIVWRVLLIVVLAVVLRAVLHRAIRRVIGRAVTGTVPTAVRPLIGRARGRVVDDSPLLTERRRQRAETIGSVLRSVASALVFTIAGAMVLSELGLDLGPVVASAGIAGVALGFGAQHLVRDVLNGMFMILEDQYGVGDAVDVGEASGIVEAIGLRVTRLRNVDGTVWHVRNGEILRVGNMSQGWSRALLDVRVAYRTDTDQAVELIKSVADGVWHDETLGPLVLEEPEVWGIEDLGPDGIAIRLVVKTAPLEQWKVARELRRRLKHTFDDADIEIPFPQRTLWVRAAAQDAALTMATDAADGAPPAAERAPAAGGGPT